MITAHTVLAGRYAADVATLLGGGSSTVLKNPTLHATISCLGDVIAARGMLLTVDGPTEVAAGIRRPPNPQMPGRRCCA